MGRRLELPLLPALVYLGACGGAHLQPGHKNSPIVTSQKCPELPRVDPSPNRFPFVLRDARTGASLSSGALDVRLLAARVIYAGESHNDAVSHDIQLALLLRLVQLAPGKEKDIALGLEMLPREMQPHLDAYVRRRVSEEEFLKLVHWDKTWGYNFGFYRPLLAYCRDHGMRIYALNATQELVKAVRKHGLNGLSEEEGAHLPDGVPWPEPEGHKRFLRSVYNQHPHGPEPPSEASFERFYLAQLVWDETMADSVARIVKARGGPSKLLVLLGSGHASELAVPGRAERRGASGGVSILAAGLTAGPSAGPGPSDPKEDRAGLAPGFDLVAASVNE